MKFGLIALLTLLAACGKSDDGKKAKNEEQGSGVANDMSKPYLSNDKITGVIETFRDSKNPFRGDGGKIKTYWDAREKIDEVNAYCRQHGCKDYADYLAVVGRIFAGRAYLVSVEAQKAASAQVDQEIQKLEAELNKPGLDEQTRSVKQQSLDILKQQREEVKKMAAEKINDEDLELVRKRAADIDAAMK
jgi:hypothetical protein